MLYGGLGVVAVLYLLALTGLMNVWWFGIGTFVLALALPALATALMPETVLTEDELAARDQTPVELVGIDVPYTEQLREQLDSSLGLDGVPASRGDHKEDAHATA